MKDCIKHLVLLAGILSIFYLPSQAFAYCGDNIIDPGESCDGGPDCPPTCQKLTYVSQIHISISVPVCGNGKIENGEACDGNAGCLPNCEWDNGSTVSVSAFECGNGLVEYGEECDDGNLNNGDGCNKNCDNESLAYKGVDVFVKENEKNSAPTSDDAQDSPSPPSSSPSEAAQNTPTSSTSSTGTSTLLPNSVDSGRGPLASGCSMMSGTETKGACNLLAYLAFGVLPLLKRRFGQKK